MRSSQSIPFQAAIHLTLAILVVSAGSLQAAGPPPVLPQSLDLLEPAVAELIRSAALEVEAEPDQAEAHGRLGMVYEANNLWPEAESCYENAATLAPRDDRWRFRLAVASRQTGNLDRSLELLQQVVTERPELAPAHQRLALALLERGELAGARFHFQRLIELEPTAPQGYTGLANVHLLEGDAAGAVSLLESALRLQPKDRQAHYLMGLSMRALGRQDEASRELAMGLGATPSYLPDALDFEIERLGVNLTARLDRAGTFLGLGRVEEATKELEITLAEHPENLQVMNNLAIAYLRLDRAVDAVTLLQRALTIDDQGFATYLNLSACYMRMGRPEEALAAPDAAVSRASEVAKTHL
ncbi:MAG: tetratricopeptide repeat protein, partial [Thermoanaerobaculia bacterium]